VARIEATARGSTGPGTGHGLIDPVRAVTAVLPGDPAPAASTSGATQPGRASRTGASGPGASAVSRAVIAGSFGLIVVVVVTAGLAIARRRRPPGSGPSGGHAA
jgi:hypothetical protein